MKFDMSPFCPVCGKLRGGTGGADHSACAKITKAAHPRKKKKVRPMNHARVEYFARYVAA